MYTGERERESENVREKARKKSNGWSTRVHFLDLQENRKRRRRLARQSRALENILKSKVRHRKKLFITRKGIF